MLDFHGSALQIYVRRSGRITDSDIPTRDPGHFFNRNAECWWQALTRLGRFFVEFWEQHFVEVLFPMQQANLRNPLISVLVKHPYFVSLVLAPCTSRKHRTYHGNHYITDSRFNGFWGLRNFRIHGWQHVLATSLGDSGS